MAKIVPLPTSVPTPENGSKVVASQWMVDHYIVLCYRDCRVDRFVTWCMDTNGNCYWGHYHETLGAAQADFAKRVGPVTQEPTKYRATECRCPHCEHTTALSPDGPATGRSELDPYQPIHFMSYELPSGLQQVAVYECPSCSIPLWVRVTDDCGGVWHMSPDGIAHELMCVRTRSVDDE